VSIHNRGSLKNTPSGWGNYLLTFMGHHRMHYYRELTEQLLWAIFISDDFDKSEEEVTSHVRVHVFVWLGLARILESDYWILLYCYWCFRFLAGQAIAGVQLGLFAIRLCHRCGAPLEGSVKQQARHRSIRWQRAIFSGLGVLVARPQETVRLHRCLMPCGCYPHEGQRRDRHDRRLQGGHGRRRGGSQEGHI